MRWFVLAALATLAMIPATVSAQEVLPIGYIPRVQISGPSLWGMSGLEIFTVRASDGNFSPISRTEVFDARTVEILSRTQAPPLRASDVHVVTKNGHTYVVVRRYLLAEVKPQDARAEGASMQTVAQRWASGVRRVFPQVAPLPSRFGI